jgi:hemolysin activation/secretion protein
VIRGILSHHPTRLLWILAFLPVMTSVFAQSSRLPESVRPGAIRPEETGKPLMPPKPPGEILKIPPVIKRPFKVEAGPKVVVQKFHLVDARDLPRYGISLAEIRSLLKKQIADHPKGFTIGQLQQVADAVTRYYRGKGLILAQAVVPVQTVASGVVDIQVYEGKLDRILTEGNHLYSATTLKEPFQDLVHRPVSKAEIESALLQLTDFPGLTVFGVFKPGELVGTADLVLRVQQEKRFNVSYRIDNHGLPETGRWRVRPTVEWNNILGGADRLQVSIQQTYLPKNNLFYSFDYDRYLGDGYSIGVTSNRNAFNVGGKFRNQDITGETRQVGGYVKKSWLRSRRLNVSTRVSFTHKKSKTQTRTRVTNLDRLSVLSLEVDFDNVDTLFKGIDFATMEWRHGFNDFLGSMGSHQAALKQLAGYRPSRQAGPPDGRFASGEFNKIFITASRLQTIRPDLSLLLRGEYQWSPDFLVPMEQYSVGGPDNVRAFPPAQALVDEAAFVSAELIQNMPFVTDVPAIGNRTWGELIQLSIFYDLAVGRLNKPLPTDPHGYQNFKGAGLQLRFNLPGTLDARLISAWELAGKTVANGRKPQIWLDITYHF